ncbi:MAG: c-type cytochrome [Ferruginibacter sp.]
MKKYCIVLSLSVFCFACGNQSDSAETSAKPASVMDSPDWIAGEKLVAKSDCFTCHKLNEASTGPSYLAVSGKYENTEANEKLLVDKVIAGGTGVWGQIPMAAHPALSKEDATAMIKYVLLQKERAKEKEKEVKK